MGEALDECMEEGDSEMSQNRNHESALKIMESLSGVDTMLLERSEAVRRRKKPLWQYGRAWAAVVCAAVVGILTWRNYHFMNGTDGNAFSSSRNSEVGAVQISSTSSDGIEGEGEDVLSSAPADNAGGWGDGSLSAAPNGAGGQGGSSPSAAPNGAGGQGESSPSAAPNGAVGQGENSPSAAPEGKEGQEVGSSSAASNEDGSQDRHAIGSQEDCGVPLNPAEKLTEAEARSKEPFHEYIPSRVPEGYGFEAAYWYEESGQLSISWSRGLDAIQVFMERTEDCHIVDINAPERYDERLYEVPYGESVPEEYREDFENPVFAWEDFSREVIESRMRSYEDSGDTDTPRGNFSILFPDGILLRFRGRGTTEQIWDMIQSLGL